MLVVRATSPGMPDHVPEHSGRLGSVGNARLIVDLNYVSGVQIRVAYRQLQRTGKSANEPTVGLEGLGLKRETNWIEWYKRYDNSPERQARLHLVQVTARRR